MSSKQTILKAIRSQTPPAAELPSLDQSWITYPDRRQQFATLLESVGGRCVFVPNIAAINEELAKTTAYTEAKQIVSLLPGVGKPNVDLDQIADPHELETVDFAILLGQFGVAENGAVWVTNDGVKHRVAYFIPQHLALVIRADQILDNMHQAYERLSFLRAGYGLFLSGPSKTADIEQSLVIGAHGPRSLTVFCITQ